MMLETQNLDDVGRALDRAMAAGAHISATLGCHTNDRMVSFYVRSPSGFDIEYGCNGWQVDWSGFTPTTSLSDSLWGHRWSFPGAPALKSWQRRSTNACRRKQAVAQLRNGMTIGIGWLGHAPQAHGPGARGLSAPDCAISPLSPMAARMWACW